MYELFSHKKSEIKTFPIRRWKTTVLLAKNTYLEENMSLLAFYKSSSLIESSLPQ